MQKLMVDGYNVIHADPALKGAAARGMEAARAALLARIRLYVAAKNVQVTVVFDGAGGLVDAEAVVPGRLQVLYSAAGQSADEVIVEALEDHPNPREYIVVTADMADIGRAVGALGAVVMSPAEFLSRIEGGRVGGGDATGDGEKPAAGGDVEYWLRQFGKTGDGDD